jgi:hypothetical protein
MFRKLTGKQKNKLLLIGTFLGLWSVYAFAIRNTMDARYECNVLQQQIDSAANAPSRLAHLKQELRQLETITGSNDTTNSLHEHLLGIVTNYCQENNITLRDFASPIRYAQQEWMVETHPIILEGSYIALLKFVQKLEQEKAGKVISVDFNSRRDNKTQSLSLTVTIYVQNIIRKKS